MKHGSIIKREVVAKYRDGIETIKETVYEERVQIIKISDYNTIVEDMHAKHALDVGYGAFLEKYNNGKMYVTKRWIVKE
jgi:hypothetical protein